MHNSIFWPRRALNSLNLSVERGFLFVRGRKESLALTVGLNFFNALNHQSDVTLFRRGGGHSIYNSSLRPSLTWNLLLKETLAATAQ